MTWPAACRGECCPVLPPVSSHLSVRVLASLFLCAAVGAALCRFNAFRRLARHWATWARSKGPPPNALDRAGPWPCKARWDATGTAIASPRSPFHVHVRAMTWGVRRRRRSHSAHTESPTLRIHRRRRARLTYVARNAKRRGDADVNARKGRVVHVACPRRLGRERGRVGRRPAGHRTLSRAWRKNSCRPSKRGALRCAGRRANGRGAHDRRHHGGGGRHRRAGSGRGGKRKARRERI
ncbi:hypothetical protein C8Q79DRAFT_951320 [Trametes meyenii]|nr:hypothetical protein C8Q79DRAFT_951320 [Trametes meyenii]